MTNHNILVSIICLTYNHETFIKKCLNGFLMQECDFNFEVLIHDDASTDKTENIIREYEESYPHIIKPIYQHSKQGTKTSFIKNVSRAKGQYIAVCDGDDYWTDPLKLQKQVDLMEKHPDVSLSYHGAMILKNHKIEKGFPEIKNLIDGYYINKSDLIRYGGGGFATSTLMGKSSYIFEIISTPPAYISISNVSDFPILLYMMTRGKIGYIKDRMTVYRSMHKGSWTANLTFETRVSNFRNRIDTIKSFNKETDYKYQNLSKLARKYAYKNLAIAYILEYCMIKSAIKITPLLLHMGFSNTISLFKIYIYQYIFNINKKS